MIHNPEQKLQLCEYMGHFTYCTEMFYNLYNLYIIWHYFLRRFFDRKKFVVVHKKDIKSDRSRGYLCVLNCNNNKNKVGKRAFFIYFILFLDIWRNLS